MIITKELLDSAATENGGYTKKQLAAIGIDWPPRKGWKTEVIGKSISEEQAEIFLDNHSPFPISALDETIARDEVSVYIYEHCKNGSMRKGSYEVLLTAKGKELRFSKEFHQTSVYPLIIQAAIDAVLKLKKPCKINLYTTTIFGFNKIAYSDGSWRNEPKDSVNIDMLLQLKDAVIAGSHRIHPMVDKELVQDKMFPHRKKFVTLSLSVELFDELKAKCHQKNINVASLACHLLEKWVKEE